MPDRNCRAALAVVTALVLGNQALVQPYLLRLMTDAPRMPVLIDQRI